MPISGSKQINWIVCVVNTHGGRDIRLVVTCNVLLYTAGHRTMCLSKAITSLWVVCINLFGLGGRESQTIVWNEMGPDNINTGAANRNLIASAFLDSFQGWVH